MRIAESKYSSKQPKWHLIYYVLAGFDLIAIGFSLLINHQITGLYIDSVEINRKWAAQLSQYSELTALAIEVNRPGNDVFLSGDATRETNYLNQAFYNFDKHSLTIRNAHNTLKPEKAARLNQYLNETISHMGRVMHSARAILSLFDSDAELAGNEMARMDNSFFSLMASIETISREVRGIQTKSLATQSAYAQSLKNYEMAITIFIFIMVMLVAFYGHFISKKVALFITEREAANASYKKLNESLESRVAQRNEDLARSNQELEKFAYIASHDMREPLRKIQAFGERLIEEEEERLSANGKDYIERMQNAAQRMRALIDGLLAYSRLGSRGPKMVSVDMNEIVRDILSDMETQIEDSKGNVEVDKLPVVVGDRLHLTQIFQNLISNALKFHPQDTNPLVRIYAKTDRQDLHIMVEDNGIGIDLEYKDKIFEVFQCLNGRSDFDSTGVGLSICKKAIELHRGSISFESLPGHGTTFDVRLPIDQVMRG